MGTGDFTENFKRDAAAQIIERGYPVGLCCTNRVGDSFGESSVVAVQYEQTHTPAYKTRNWPA